MRGTELPKAIGEKWRAPGSNLRRRSTAYVLALNYAFQVSSSFSPQKGSTSCYIVKDMSRNIFKNCGKQMICPLIARKITSCIFIARSTARAEYSSIGFSPFPMGLYPNPNNKTGHFTCYIHRTDHLLATFRCLMLELFS